MAKRPVSVMEQLESALQDVRAGRRRHVVVEPPPVPAYTAAEIRGIRDALNMSQAEFAELLDVSPRSVQAWEQSVRAPGLGVCYLLEHYSSPDWVEKLRFPEPPARRPGSAGETTAGVAAMSKGSAITEDEIARAKAEGRFQDLGEAPKQRVSRKRRPTGRRSSLPNDRREPRFRA